uniref:Probable reverse transcriptase At2g02650-, related n=1 Tax=Medicago truncatula TaxID=3880 RepID=Q2HUH0_MEDTR|nr:probable reverse transcriptase At2g02650 -, related [Medicago truncatula]
MAIFIREIITSYILQHQLDDRLIWKSEKNGCYFVRGVENTVGDSILKTTGEFVEDNFLPELNWTAKGVTCTCVVCNEANEDSYHLFFQCSTAVNIWQSSGLWISLDPLVQQ